MDKKAIIEWADNLVENILKVPEWYNPTSDMQKAGIDVCRFSTEMHVYTGIYAVADALGVKVSVRNRYASLPDYDESKEHYCLWEHSFNYKGVTFFQISCSSEPANADKKGEVD